MKKIRNQNSKFKNLEVPAARRGNRIFDFLYSERKRDAFTLLETIVALAVIVSAIVGPFTLATQGIFSAKFAKKKIVALNLTQEGIEIIRSYRENNVLAGAVWDDGILSGETRVDIICNVTPCTTANSANYNVCASPCIPLRLDSSSNLYSYSTGNNSPFTRIVTVERLSADQLKVTSRVTWLESGVERKVELQEVLYNWQ